MSNLQFKASVYSYGSALSALKGRDRMKLAHNTSLERLSDGSIGVKYHATYIAKFYDSGVSIYTHGGWRTLTTKDRLNRLLPQGNSIFQKDHVWYLWNREGDWTVEWNDPVTFQDFW